MKRSIDLISFLLVTLFIMLTVPCAALQNAEGGRFSITTGEGWYCFGTYLFSIDPSITKHPDSVCGRSSSAALHARLGKGFSLFGETIDNRTKGYGSWLDIDGSDPQEAAYLPVATGTTRLRMRGAMLGARKSFGHRRLAPYMELGAGVGTMDLSFIGMATATDPTDGEVFTVPATDRVHQYIPIGKAGGGLEVRLRRGLAAFASYDWELGSTVHGGLRYTFPGLGGR